MNTIKNTVATRVKQLQKWMEEERLDAFIVPTIDPHNSEYTPDHWKAREWLTGFDGSAGTAVVLDGKRAGRSGPTRAIICKPKNSSTARHLN